MSVHPMETVPRVSINRVIPGSLAITHAGTDLYSIGLSNHKPFNAPKRRWFHKPIVVFAVLFSQLLKYLSSILLFGTKSTEKFHAIVGDITYFLGPIRNEVNIGMIVIIIIALSSQLLNY